MESELTLTLANTPLDLQITICIFLHPSDILALRKTCKALEIATRKRIVWVTVLRQVCLDNTLFLPSFPIPDMSDLELERAAMGPHRWIEFCGATGAFQKQHSDDVSEIPPLPTDITHKGTVDSLFIVPGGRYLVTTGNKGLFVWDLGCVSTQAVDCKLVASVERQYRSCLVQATPDGMGLVILASSTVSCDLGRLSIFEVYPQSEIPLLTEIASLDRVPMKDVAHLLPDTLILRVIPDHRIVFRFVDYRTNYSTCFSLDVDVDKINSRHNIKTFATKTAIILFCEEGILIWAIPPLSPQSSDFPYHFLDSNLAHIPPLIEIPYPDDILRHIVDHEILEWMTVSSWYFGSRESVYFDMLCTDSKLQRFEIIIKPDLSGASLQVKNMPQIISNDLMRFMEFMELLEGYGHRDCEGYRICEDALVYFWNNTSNSDSWGAYTGLTSAPFTNAFRRWDGHYAITLSFCPTSGRFVYSDDERGIVIVDAL